MILTIIAALWLIAALVQLNHWLIVVWPLATHKGRQFPPKDGVSIIICTHSATPSLRPLIYSALSQDYPLFEVILVNDGPDTAVANMTKAIDDPRFRLISFDASAKVSGGKKEALAHGIQHATYRWLLLTDADCEVRSGWIKAMMTYASPRRRLVLGYSPIIKTAGLVNIVSRFDTALIAFQYLGAALRKRPYMGVGRNLLYRKDLFAEVDGFDAHLEVASGDDDLFVQQAARLTDVTIAIDPDGIVYTHGKTTWSALLNQKRRHMTTAPAYPRGLSVRLAILAASFIGFWIVGICMCILDPSIPLFLFALVAASQWFVFGRVAKRFELRDLVRLYPLWAIIYSFFLIFQGIAFFRTKNTQEWS